MNESHPRSSGPAWARYRREAEDILCEAGAAILHLPDFFGPQMHISTFQNALNEAASGKTVNWIGKAEVHHHHHHHNYWGYYHHNHHHHYHHHHRRYYYDPYYNYYYPY